MNDVVITKKGLSILADADVVEEISADWFDPGRWQELGAVRRQLGGRGQALLLETPSGMMVLRRFQRGGLAARLSSDRYFDLGVERSRSFREFRLLKELVRKGLPVPLPVAASHERAGLFYRAGLLTRLIPGARELAELAPSLSMAQWRDLADTLDGFFSAGLRHPDLNARNLLLDERGCWYLLDLDGADLTGEKVNSKSMRLRLARSLEKSCVAGWQAGFEATLGSDVQR